MKMRSTSRWSTASEKWEYTWTAIPLDAGSRPDGMVAGIPVGVTPEGKPSSTWTPFSVTQGEGSALVWWRRSVISAPEELGPS